MCFNNKYMYRTLYGYMYRTLYGGCYQVIIKTKQAEKEKQTFFDMLY